MAIKVIIMDIDGTLVNDEKVITPLTKETLLKAQEKGVRLILASGRPTSGLLKLALKFFRCSKIALLSSTEIAWL